MWYLVAFVGGLATTPLLLAACLLIDEKIPEPSWQQQSVRRMRKAMSVDP